MVLCGKQSRNDCCCTVYTNTNIYIQPGKRENYVLEPIFLLEKQKRFHSILKNSSYHNMMNFMVNEKGSII